jgi:hypothetical protein
MQNLLLSQPTFYDSREPSYNKKGERCSYARYALVLLTLSVLGKSLSISMMSRLTLDVKDESLTNRFKSIFQSIKKNILKNITVAGKFIAHRKNAYPIKNVTGIPLGLLYPGGISCQSDLITV